MPFKGEHSARLESPDTFKRLRRVNDQFGTGIDAIFGIGDDNKSRVQAIRFDSLIFTTSEARRWLRDHDKNPIKFEPAVKESIQDPLPGLKEAQMEAMAKRIDEHIERTKVIEKAKKRKKKKKFYESSVPSGVHPHPHEMEGIHDHLGLPDQTGKHDHEVVGLNGGHTHREGDPIDGWHLGDESDEGNHVHILAHREDVPELMEWFTQIVESHYPTHAWLEGHIRTWVVGMDESGNFSNPRPATEEDFMAHSLWSLHSAGANPKVHEAIFLNPETRILRIFYEFEGGEIREATMEDFLSEESYLDEKFPFPEEIVVEKLS